MRRDSFTCCCKAAVAGNLAKNACIGRREAEEKAEDTVKKVATVGICFLPDVLTVKEIARRENISLPIAGLLTEYGCLHLDHSKR